MRPVIWLPFVLVVGVVGFAEGGDRPPLPMSGLAVKPHHQTRISDRLQRGFEDVLPRPDDHIPPSPYQARGGMPDIEYGDRDGNVEIIGRWANGPCYCAAAVGDTLYFGLGGYLVIADVSDPASIVELGRVLLPSVPRDVAVTGGYAYVADELFGLRIVDISDPANAREVGFYDTGNKGYRRGGSGRLGLHRRWL